MKYDDLDKTKDLFDIVDEVPSPIENIEMEGVNKENLARLKQLFRLLKKKKSLVVRVRKKIKRV